LSKLHANHISATVQVGRTLEKLEKVKEVHGKNISGEIIPLQGDVTKKSEVEYVDTEKACLNLSH